uniref:Uncharacterized protein n=1 Tax=Rhipicephalus zambeziensis TaxID=60191 RepID=A0A224Y806_9ACAR
MARKALPQGSAVCVLAVCLVCLSAQLANCLEWLCQGMWTRLHTGAAPELLRGKPGSALRASLGLPSRQQGVQLCLQPLQLHRIYIEAFLGLLGLAWRGGWARLLVGASICTRERQLFAGAHCSWDTFFFTSVLMSLVGSRELGQGKLCFYIS